MADTETARNFGNETHDDCTDDARTQENRDAGGTSDRAQKRAQHVAGDNAQQRARSKESDEPPTRGKGNSK